MAFGQKSLAAAQLLLRAPAFRVFAFQRHPGEMLFGHVDERAHELDDLAVLVEDGVADAMDIAQAPVRQENPPVDVEILLFPDRSVDNLDEIGAILRKNALKGLLEGLQVLNRIQAKNPVVLRRPIDVLAARDVPGPASCVRQPLSFLEIGFDAAQFRLHPRAFGSGPDRHHPIGQVIGEVAEMRTRLLVESVRPVGVEGEGAERRSIGLQRKRERGPIAAPERLIAPMPELRVGRDIVDPAEL